MTQITTSGHGCTTGDEMHIPVESLGFPMGGAGYDGRFVVSGVTGDTFTISTPTRRDRLRWLFERVGRWFRSLD